MTGFAIAEYLIVVLEVFLICDVSARGLKPEMVERKESLIYLCASVGLCMRWEEQESVQESIKESRESSILIS